ncbi:CaiB/BaiF CoA transferase family protein [Jiangella asiatica]|nr:CaiB/BaiF CoA-transferase family protein [Jiangella asiatica]
MATARSLPLNGIRVLDFSQVQFGPMATQILADFGADVIKVERPRLGDISRSIDVKSDGLEDSASFHALNRNKRSIVLDMKRPEAMEIVYALLEQTDVLVANYRAGVAERLGLGYEDLRERYPRLIYASGTGFGETGPMKHLGGQDMALQSISGATWHNRDSNGRPAIYPIPFVDFGAGMAITQGILLALFERAVSGQGQRVDVSLLDTAMFEQMQEYTAWMMRRFEIHWERDNLVGAFKTSDGWVTIVGLFRPDPLRAVCEALGIDDLTLREEFRTPELQQQNRSELWAILDEELSRFTTDEAVDRLAAAGVICGPVLDYDQVLENPQVVHNDVVRTLHHPVTGDVCAIDNPIRLSAATERPYVAAPLLGQHTDSVLADLGYTGEQIEALVKSGVVENAAVPTAS